LIAPEICDDKLAVVLEILSELFLDPELSLHLLFGGRPGRKRFYFLFDNYLAQNGIGIEELEIVDYPLTYLFV